MWTFRGREQTAEFGVKHVNSSSYSAAKVLCHSCFLSVFSVFMFGNHLLPSAFITSAFHDANEIVLRAVKPRPTQVKGKR
jgi:hypothetical protein